jgi:hypothetical protein
VYYYDFQVIKQNPVWEVQHSDEFEIWWDGLSEPEQVSIGGVVLALEQLGPQLRYPYSSDIHGARNGRMRELRIQHQGHPYRVLYAFDADRRAILLLGGDKTGDDGWYAVNVPKADSIYERHAASLAAEKKALEEKKKRGAGKSQKGKSKKGKRK